jgi:HSP20 family protein
MTRKTSLIPFLPLRDEFLTPFDRIFDDIMRSTFPEFSKDFGVQFFEKGSRPKVDIIDFDDKIRIKAEVSGLSKEDVKVSCKDGYLTISGEKKIDNESDGKAFLLKELSHSKFSRTFQLGDKLDSKSIKADFKNGLLTIDVPKINKEELESNYEIKID